MVYANKPATIDALRTNIEREIAAVSADLCLKIVKSWVQRLVKRACGNRVSFLYIQVMLSSQTQLKLKDNN